MNIEKRIENVLVVFPFSGFCCYHLPIIVSTSTINRFKRGAFLSLFSVYNSTSITRVIQSLSMLIRFVILHLLVVTGNKIHIFWLLV